MPKGEIGRLQILKNYIYDFTGRGDFLIQDRAKDINYRIKNIHALRTIAPEKIQLIIKMEIFIFFIDILKFFLYIL